MNSTLEDVEFVGEIGRGEGIGE